MQGRFKRDSGAAGDPEQQPGGTGNGSQAAADSGTAAPGTTAAPGRMSMPSGLEAGKITGLDGKPGPRIAMRNWRISTRLISLLALPVVTASALGGLRINSSLDNIHQLEHMKTLTDITEQATNLAAALQEERDSSAGPLSANQKNNDAVAASRQATDRDLKLYEQATDDISDDDPVFSGVRATLVAIGGQLANLNEIRGEAYTSQSGIAQTVSEYDGLVTSLLSLSQDMAQATSNSEMIKATRALSAFSSAKEYESMQRAVISAAFASGGKLNADEYQSVKWAAADENTAITRFMKVYGTDAASLLRPIQGDNDTIAAHDNERERIASSQGAITKINSSYLDWDDAAKTKIDAMNQIERSLLSEMQQKSLHLQSEAKREALISGAIILLVLGVAVVGAFVVGRSMVRSLRRLQQTAQDVAQKRLPELVKQLSDTDPQDVDTSVESIGINSRDEIGQVARAFDEVHSEAVRLAAEQALLRGNVNAMFTNLSRRSQGLIQRQLSLISELESREADPDQLSSLFKLDHLATRMRRNGENLLVLAGEEPGRRWTRPVPLVDVLRAAASEVEQYERIELTSVPSAEVTGRIVNDLVHLLAELLENATSFSSPQTKVRVTGHSLPDGRVLIEIHDTGIGLSPEDLADINERLANPPTVDVAVSRRMGLFVVGRLSLRHGIRIQLRPSDSGGTTALVMLPVDVTQGGANAKGAAPGGRPAAAVGGGAGTGIAGAFGNAGQGGNRAGQRGQVGSGAARPALPGRQPGGTGGPGGPGGPGGNAGPGAPQPAGQRWTAQDNPQQGFGEDTPRGHEEAEAPAFDAFDQSAPGNRQQPQQPQPQQPGAGRPGPLNGPGGFPAPQPQNTGPSGFRSDVFGGRSGPMQRPGNAGATGPTPAAASGGPGDTSQFPAVRADGGAPGAQGGGAQNRLPQRGPRGPQGGAGWNPDEQRGGRPGDTGSFPLPGGAGDTAQFPAVRDEGFPQGPGPGQSQGQGQGRPGDTGSFPQPGGAGDTSQFPAVRADGFPQNHPQGPGQGQSQGQGQGRPGDTGSFDTGSFPQPGGAGDTSQFPAVRADGFPQNHPQGPGQGQSQGQGQGRPGDTGSFALPGGPGDTSQFPAVRADGGPGAYPDQQSGPAPAGGLPQRGPRGPQGTPGWSPQGQGGQPQQVPDPYATGAQPMPGLGDTGPYPVPHQPQQHDGLPPYQGQHGGGQQPAPRPEPQLPGPAEPMALPPAPTRGDEPTPIFASIESDWFRTGQAERMQQIHVEQSGRGQQAPPPRPVGRTAPPQRPRTDRPGPSPADGPQRLSGGPQPAVQAGAAAPGPMAQSSAQNGIQAPSAPGAEPLPRETPNWRTSPNDALRQRAEAIREPTAGGVTPSGLPRRVPRANLVAGGATPQQAPQGGPQVSRSPDDVRGRLTNLRRGIQQGRQAGGTGTTDGRGFGMNNQER
ncbi:putative sensor-like histidine kinase [Actinacidiphila reveromycinica]|uniref:histidine kinase n=1 Tax=Actinacidiphila reveromycinica TaxID=659352 RepID=A0A7U3UX62_9ACTN|nr:nitrate- and nitrite sensing domain-containing protein [Streptomyces sp. SN-593]BBB00407.1 putative sensor-like histidine kinase [Streptomyces sp. SN-593]